MPAKYCHCHPEISHPQLRVLNKQTKDWPFKSNPEEGKLCWLRDQTLEKVSRKCSSHLSNSISSTGNCVWRSSLCTIYIINIFPLWSWVHIFGLGIGLVKWKQREEERETTAAAFSSPTFLGQILISDAQPSESRKTQATQYAHVYKHIWKDKCLLWQKIKNKTEEGEQEDVPMLHLVVKCLVRESLL